MVRDHAARCAAYVRDLVADGDWRRDSAGGRRASATFAEVVVREINRVKPLREHFTGVQTLASSAVVGVKAVARSLMMRRNDMPLVDDRSQPWEAYLQTEEDEPFEHEDGTFLETTP